jgi:hypothetical protein
VVCCLLGKREEWDGEETDAVVAGYKMGKEASGR